MNKEILLDPKAALLDMHRDSFGGSVIELSSIKEFVVEERTGAAGVLDSALGNPGCRRYSYLGCSSCGQGLPMKGEGTCPHCGATLANYSKFYIGMSDQEADLLMLKLRKLSKEFRFNNLRAIAEMLLPGGSCRAPEECLMHLAENIAFMRDELSACGGWTEVVKAIQDDLMDRRRQNHPLDIRDPQPFDMLENLLFGHFNLTRIHFDGASTLRDEVKVKWRLL